MCELPTNFFLSLKWRCVLLLKTGTAAIVAEYSRKPSSQLSLFSLLSYFCCQKHRFKHHGWRVWRHRSRYWIEGEISLTNVSKFHLTINTCYKMPTCWGAVVGSKEKKSIDFYSPVWKRTSRHRHLVNTCQTRFTYLHCSLIWFVFTI